MLQVLFGDPNEKKVTRYTGLVNQINALGTDIKGLSDKDLQDKLINLLISKQFYLKPLHLLEKLLFVY
jgi:preprotein translocase subunit SecA